MAKGKKHFSLYLIQGKISDSVINAVGNDNPIELWHNGLSHMSEKGLTVLAIKKSFLWNEECILKEVYILLRWKTNQSLLPDILSFKKAKYA